MTMEEVTVAVFIAEKSMLRRRERMDGSDAGIVRNSHVKTALSVLERLWTILCVAHVEISIKLIFKNQYTKLHFDTALRTRLCPRLNPVLPLPLGQKRILQASRFLII
jgi:hypothetical protein